MSPSAGPRPWRARSRLESARPWSPMPPPTPSSGVGRFLPHAHASATSRHRTSRTGLLAGRDLFSSGTGVTSVEPRRPRRLAIIAVSGGQLFLRPTLPVRDPQRTSAAARRREDEVAAIGRPRRILVAAGAGDGPGTRSVGLSDDDLEGVSGARGIRDVIALR